MGSENLGRGCVESLYNACSLACSWVTQISFTKIERDTDERHPRWRCLTCVLLHSALLTHVTFTPARDCPPFISAAAIDPDTGATSSQFLRGEIDEIDQIPLRIAESFCECVHVCAPCQGWTMRGSRSSGDSIVRCYSISIRNASMELNLRYLIFLGWPSDVVKFKLYRCYILSWTHA